MMASTKFNIGYMIFLSFVAAIGGLLSDMIQPLFPVPLVR